MRAILKLAGSVALLWTIGWFLAASALEEGLARWLDARRAEGWQAEARITTSGFPGRLVARLDTPALADPDTGLAWTAPVLTLATSAANPTAVAVTWPADQTLSTPFERIDIRAAGMTGLLDIVPTGLVLEAAEVTLRDVTLGSTLGWRATLDAGSLSTARRDAAPLTHDIAFSADRIGLPDPARAAIDPRGVLPDRIGALALRAAATFDRPWDRRAIEERRPQITALSLASASGRWGEIEIEAKGELTVAPDGTPTGRIDLRATNWREILRAAVAAGAVPAEMEPGLDRALSLLAALSGNPRTIDAPIAFEGGLARLGPVPLGPAPRLVIR